MKYYVNINRHIILKNKKYGTDDPPIRVTRSKSGKPTYTKEFIVKSANEVKFIYSPQKPLPCGARVWVEIEVE